jgi:hypothetical protein
VSSWAVVAVALLSAACTTAPVHAPQTPAPAPDVGEQQGTPGWEITHPGPEHAIEGFADHTSVLPGAAVRLFVSTTAAHYTVTAFRMGAYRGSDALRVWTSPPSAGSVQAPPVVQAPTRTVVAPWRPSLEVPTQGWLRAYAEGPAGRAHPAVDNLAALHVPGARPNPAPTLPPGNSATP